MVFLAVSSASAKPRVAIAPIKGDIDETVGPAIGDAIGDEARIVPVAQVSDAMERLGLSGELDPKDAVRLETKLRASVIVQGKVTKSDGARTLRVTVLVRGKKPSKFSVQYKKAGSTKFKKE